MTARALERLEALLTGIYDLDIGCRVEDFLVTDRQSLPGQCRDPSGGAGLNLADCWTALEGISHFLCVAHNAGHDRPVSRLTLELQAEIDKYVASFALLRQRHPRRFPAELHSLLFQRARIDPVLAAGHEPIYRRASREAARFCARLEPRLRSLCGRGDGSWLGELRRFYRLSDFGKLRHIQVS
jgi:hypothetical protein